MIRNEVTNINFTIFVTKIKRTTESYFTAGCFLNYMTVNEQHTHVIIAK